MGTGFSKKKKEARMMQEQFMKMQKDAQETEVTGTAGNGLVSITLTGEGTMKQVKIKPECVDPEDIEGLESLIKAAYQDAQKQIQSSQTQNMPKLPSMPGFMGL